MDVDNGDKKLWLECSILESKGDYRGAYKCYEKLYREGRTTQIDIHYYKLCEKLGDISKKLDMMVDAERYYQESLERLTKNYDPVELSALYLKLGIVKHRLGKIEESLTIYQKAESLLNQIKDEKIRRKRLLSIVNNRAVIYLLKGNIDRAVDEFSKILRRFKQAEVSDSEETGKFFIPALINVGNIFLETSELTKAFHYLSKAEELMETYVNVPPSLKVKAYVSLATVLINENRLSEAYERFNKSREIIHRADINAKIHYLIALSKYWQAKGKVDIAILILEKSRKLAGEVQNKEIEGFVYNELGNIHKIQGNYRQALEYLTRARKAFGEIDFYKHRIRTTIEEIESSYLEIASQWGEKVELKDPYTLGHSARTTYYAFLIGKKLLKDELSLKGLLIGGFLHDIGKLKIDDKILLKPGKLTPEERLEIQKHPVYAIEQLENVEFPWKNVKDCILYHHEKYDGTGYPEGLKGEQIPVCARIIAVADVFDALTTDRPYRPALSWQKALDFIVQGKGKAFDPEVVDTFVRIIEGLDKSLISTQHTRHMVEELWRFFA